MITIPEGLNLNDIKVPYNLPVEDCKNEKVLEQQSEISIDMSFESDLHRSILENEDCIKILDEITPVVSVWYENKYPRKEGLPEPNSVSIYQGDFEAVANVVVNETLKQARKLDRDIVSMDGVLRQYDGKYFKVVDVSFLTAFLSLSGQKAGLDDLTSTLARFCKLLEKQVAISAMGKKFERKALMNLGNGVICIKKDKHTFREHSKEDYFTSVLPFDFDENATCPKFDKYLLDVLPDPESRQMLCEFFGYLIVPNFNIAKVLICIGKGRNGKSLAFKVLASLLGKENVSNFSLKEICEDSNARLNMEHKLLNYSDEMSAKFDSNTFKTLAAGEPISVKKLYKDRRDMTSYGKLAFSTNEFPFSRDKSLGFYERFLFVDFNQTIHKSKRNPHLHEEIAVDELPGVFNLMLRGAKTINVNKRFSDSKRSEEILENFQHLNDNVLQFLDEYQYMKSMDKMILLCDLFKIYQEYCNDNGFHAGSSKTLSKTLKNKEFRVGRSGGGGRTHVWIEKKIVSASDELFYPPIVDDKGHFII